MKKKYHLTSEQEEKRKILAVLAHPGRFAFLSKLYSGENALSTEDVYDWIAANDLRLDNFHATIITPLREVHVLQVERDIVGKGSQYYIHPDASDFVQSLLKLLFEESEVGHDA